MLLLNDPCTCPNNITLILRYLYDTFLNIIKSARLKIRNEENKSDVIINWVSG